MNRYEDATEEATEVVREVMSEHFPELRNAQIKILFDTKKKTSGGRIVLGRMKKSNDLERHLAKGEVEEGYDYIMYLDKAAFTNIHRDDKIRLVRHEIRHCITDPDSDNPYKLRGHDIEDFYEEIELNRDDPRWAERAASVADSVYSADN